MKYDEFTPLITRLERASDILRNGGSLLQAIARRYYLMYTYALQAAEAQGVTFRHGTDRDDDRRPTHQALPNIIRALYTGYGTISEPYAMTTADERTRWANHLVENLRTLL